MAARIVVAVRARPLNDNGEGDMECDALIFEDWERSEARLFALR